MNFNDKDKRKGYPPSNIASGYYTDPVYSSDAFYGSDNGYIDTIDEEVQDLGDTDDKKALDEPVESWGWINNVDNKQV